MQCNIETSVKMGGGRVVDNVLGFVVTENSCRSSDRQRFDCSLAIGGPIRL